EEKYGRHEALGQDLAAIYAGLGDKDQAFAWLEKDFQARSGLLARIRWQLSFDPLRSDPRFADLLRRIALKPQPTLLVCVQYRSDNCKNRKLTVCVTVDDAQRRHKARPL